MRNLLVLITLFGILTGCKDRCDGISEEPTAERGSVNINGYVLGVHETDTVSLPTAKVLIKYIDGWDEDCGHYYSESDTLYTDDSGFFNMPNKAFDACGYYYEISKDNYSTLIEGFDNNNSTGTACPDSLDGVKIYLKKD